MINIKEYKQKNIIISILIIISIGMIIGYAALLQQLSINGTAEVTSTWDIRMENISEGVTSNSTGVVSTAKVNSAELSGNTTAIFDVSLETPGDTVDFDITIKNYGSLDAKLSNVTATATNDSEEPLELTEANGINYEITIDGESVSDAENSVVSSGETATVHVKVYWDQNATEVPVNKTKKLLVNVEYIQA